MNNMNDIYLMNEEFTMIFTDSIPVDHTYIIYDCTETTVGFPGTSTPILRTIVRSQLLSFPGRAPFYRKSKG